MTKSPLTTTSTGTAIRSGIPWFDDRGEPVNAHGACVVEAEGRYYLFGEYKSDDVNGFAGFSCYSSENLVDWTFERMALPLQPDGLLGPGRVGERPKVMRCPATGRYVMYMHADSRRYVDPCIGVAISDNVAGPYTLLGPLAFDGAPLRRWDMGSFQDEDGTGYILLHEGDIYRLSADYLTADALVAERIAEGGESPAMFVDDGTYFVMFSHKTSWERNDNYYLTAPAVSGPWTMRGLIAPEGTRTHNSQCTFVLSLQRPAGVVHMYMGDRWSFPRQASAATYVWQPLRIADDTAQLTEFLPAWSPDEGSSTDISGTPVEAAFTAGAPGPALDLSFEGRAVAVMGSTDAGSGYARITVSDARGETVHAGYIDFYSAIQGNGLRYLTPELPAARYRLRIEATGEMPICFNKAGTRFGADGSQVSVSGLVVVP